MEVDASTTGVGAILSQQQGNPSRLHPCAFFSHKLIPAERNYDIGNRELIAIKLALEEWRHWLEGAKRPFTVLTDHKNLQYLSEAKRLNPRQARWALFFTRFNCKITYHPGPKDTAMETAEQMFNHMFRYFGIPEEIVSDSIHFQSMEELPQAPRCDCQSIVWVPPADQRADGEKDPGNRSFPANLLLRPPAILEPVYWLGRVRPELLSTIHWTHSLPVRARFPATFVPLG